MAKTLDRETVIEGAGGRGHNCALGLRKAGRD